LSQQTLSRALYYARTPSPTHVLASRASITPNQKHWDLLLPVYPGNASEKFDCSKLTACLIQVKNTKRNNLYILQKNHYRQLFNLNNPIIAIHADLGAKKSKTSGVQPFSEKVFGFIVSGASETTYKCATTKSISEILLKILNHTSLSGNDAQSLVSNYNVRFRHDHHWDTQSLKEQLPPIPDEKEQIKLPESEPASAPTFSTAIASPRHLNSPSRPSNALTKAGLWFSRQRILDHLGPGQNFLGLYTYRAP